MTQVSIATLIHWYAEGGGDLAPAKELARQNGWRGVPEPKIDAANDSALDLSRFDVANRWSDIPVREWLLGNVALRCFYSLFTSPGGRGKTAMAVMLAVASAMGRGDMCEMVVRDRLRVIFISGEDSGQEMMRRVRAVCQRYGITAQDLGGRLLVIGARELPGLALNRIDPMTKQATLNAPGIAKLEEVIRDHRADLVFIDPLISFFPAGINDNSSTSVVMGAVSGICEAQRCGIVLVHHISKASVTGGGESSAMAALGAVSISSHARTAFALTVLTERDAPTHGVTPSEAGRYFLFTNTKANLARSSAADLFFLESVTLPNADPAKGYPVGDHVQVAVPAVQVARPGLYPDSVLRAAVECLARGASCGGAYSQSPISADRNYRPTVAAALAASFPDQSVRQREFTAQGAVEVAVQRGWVEQTNVKLPRKPGAGKGGGTTAKGLLVRWDLTPWSQDAAPGPQVAPKADFPPVI